MKKEETTAQKSPSSARAFSVLNNFSRFVLAKNTMHFFRLASDAALHQFGPERFALRGSKLGRPERTVA